MKLAVVGAGWAGLAAAVEAASAGTEVTLFEMARAPGGRARALEVPGADAQPVVLDNGQHILIGAYRETLGLMQRVGVSPAQHLLALPLGLPFPDGSGVQAPAWAAALPAPLDALAAIAGARGWTWGERAAFLRASLAWRRGGFDCDARLTVAQLCEGMPARAMDDLIEPLCVSALNLPTTQADARLFLRVMRDALFGPGFGDWSPSSLLLPRSPLSALWPEPALRWLAAQPNGRTQLRLGTRVRALHAHRGRWRLDIELQGAATELEVDRVIWATGAAVAAQTMAETATRCDDAALAQALHTWAQRCGALDFTAIATVYAWAPGLRLRAPMLALRASADGRSAPAQFVFDRGQIATADAAQQGVLAFVVSAAHGDRTLLQAQVLQQAREQLGLDALQVLRTVLERRATFACTPALQRPPAEIAPGLLAAGDYVEGPYPATLEAAVRSGLDAARRL